MAAAFHLGVGPCGVSHTHVAISTGGVSCLGSHVDENSWGVASLTFLGDTVNSKLPVPPALTAIHSSFPPRS